MLCFMATPKYTLEIGQKIVFKYNKHFINKFLKTSVKDNNNPVRKHYVYIKPYSSF